MKDDNKELQQTLDELIGLEETKFPKAKEIHTVRNELRKHLKNLLESRAQLPENSQFYASLIACPQRIKWKEVALYLKEETGMHDEKYNKIIDEHSVPRERIKYGPISKVKSSPRFRQLEFTYLTPNFLPKP